VSPLRLGPALFAAAAFAGCAPGDSLFADARATHSGEHARLLAASRDQVAGERRYGAGLEARGEELRTREADVRAEVDRGRRELAALQARVDDLDREIKNRRAATAEASARQRDLERRVGEVRQEIAAVQRQLASSPTSGDLARLLARKAELEERLNELTQLYQAL
jgi:chromosome segregation ATPase